VERGGGTRPLHLHLGLAKTGTTYLQGILAENRPALREAGTIYPFIWPEGLFHAAVDVVGQYDEWAVPTDKRAGAWEALVSRAEGFEGAALISHEILALASADQARAALDRLAGYDVHLVVTVRDLARQLPAYWQESVKNGSTLRFGEVVADVLGERGAPPSDFWQGQHLLQVLDRWSAGVAPERVHVVTCPPADVGPEELWRRFADATGVPTSIADGTRPAANPSLGCAQVALLRALNRTLVDELCRADYLHVVKRLYAQRVLAGSAPVRAARTPARLREPLTAIARTWIAEIVDRGYRVHGDLDDLLPTSFAEDGREPDDVGPEELAALAPSVDVALIRELVRLRAERSAPGPE
jgi:hypothetical protein